MPTKSVIMREQGIARRLTATAKKHFLGFSRLRFVLNSILNSEESAKTHI